MASQNLSNKQNFKGSSTCTERNGLLEYIAQLAGRGQWPSQMARSMKAGRLENEETRRTRWRHESTQGSGQKQSILAHIAKSTKGLQQHRRGAPATVDTLNDSARQHQQGRPSPLHCQHRGHTREAVMRKTDTEAPGPASQAPLHKARKVATAA